jgi:dTDP-4-amino-4,6-dideoxygalactose transaminase
MATDMKVPFLDLKAGFAPYRAAIDAAIKEVIDSAVFAGGPFVEIFEDDFARYCDSLYAVGVGNGTDALWLPLLALGIGPGDEVITVPNSFIATAEAISYTGATPVFVDVDPFSYTMNPDLLARALTSRTKAIIPVHLFGQPADMDSILQFAREYGLYVIEDAAQAHGAKYKGKTVGTFGDAAAFSFYPGKNLGAFGEAGAVVTQNADFARKIEILREHGQVKKYEHALVGWNARMDGIQAAVLTVKLRHLAAANWTRRSIAAYYDTAFASLSRKEEIVRPFVRSNSEPVYHVYAIQVRERDEVMRFLNNRGIGTGIHYPTPIHLTEAYRYLGYGRGDFPVVERCAERFLSLPMYPELTRAQLETVVETVEEAVELSKITVPLS